jgi:SAM-dependent methyltransferase
VTLTVFTPSHKSQFLPDLYRSLQAQSDPDWQWTILGNNGAERQDFGDKRVTWLDSTTDQAFVGALKAEVCERTSGDILLEVDHDDLLTPTAVADVKHALSGKAGFCFSNTMPANMDFTKGDRYSETFGWRYREADYQGHTLDEHIAFAPNADSLSRIWYAPNHLRAFKRDVYDQVGGYNREMRVLDDQDLMCRLYQATEFAHIDKPLYVQRLHGENTQIVHNKEIQDNVWRLHDLYAEALALVWAKRSGLRALELGGRFDARQGFETVDLKDAQVCCDLDQRWPFEDSSVGVIRAADIFEHLRDPLHTMKEAFRVLAPGGWIFAQVPSTDGRGAWQDPTHRSFWNANSWLYYTHRNWARYIDTPVRFQAVKSGTTEKDARGVCWTFAHLISLKGGYRPPGLVEI